MVQGEAGWVSPFYKEGQRSGTSKPWSECFWISISTFHKKVINKQISPDYFQDFIQLWNYLNSQIDSSFQEREASFLWPLNKCKNSTSSTTNISWYWMPLCPVGATLTGVTQYRHAGKWPQCAFCKRCALSLFSSENNLAGLKFYSCLWLCSNNMSSKTCGIFCSPWEKGLGHSWPNHPGTMPQFLLLPIFSASCL